MLSLPFIALLAWLAAALGMQLGIPPEKEEPILSYVAPEHCVLYASWSAMATPSATGGNQAEQLLAEPDVLKFLTVLESTLTTAAVAAAKNKGIAPEQADQITKTVQLWLRTVLTKSAAAYVSRFEPKNNDLDVQAAVIIKAGDTAVELDQSFTTLWSQGQEKPTETTVAGRPFRKLKLEAEKLDLVWGASNGYMMIGLGPEALDEMSIHIRARQELTWLTQVKSNLPVERRSTVTYVNFRKLLQNFAPFGDFDAKRLIYALGLKHLHSFQAVSGLDESGMCSRALVAIDGYTGGIWSLLGEKPITQPI
jgi:hypothetical protein